MGLGLKAPPGTDPQSLSSQTKCSIQILESFLFEPSSESSAAFTGDTDGMGTEAP